MLKSVRRSGARAAALLAAGTLALGGMVVATAVPATAADPVISEEPIVGTFYGSYAIIAGEVWGWGTNSYGQLGIQPKSPYEVLPPTKIAIPVATGVTIKQISSVYDSVLALDSAGNVWSWGRDGEGQLGRTANSGNSYTPLKVDIPAGEFIVQVSVGSVHSMALASDGSVWTWGSNSQGQLGTGTTIDNMTPHPVPTEITNFPDIAVGEKIIEVSAGSYHSLALSDKGRVWSWGTAGELGNKGALGNPNVTSRSNVPVQVGSNTGADGTFVALAGIDAIDAGYDYALALDNQVLQDVLWSWGSDDNGKLGDNAANSHSFRPVAVNMTGMPADIVQIEAGSDHALVLGSDGSVWGWGSNGHYASWASKYLGKGRLAIPWTTQATSFSVPQRVFDAGSGYTYIAAGYNQSMGVTAAGVSLWGGNEYGELGLCVKDNDQHPIPLALDLNSTACPANWGAAKVLDSATPKNGMGPELASSDNGANLHVIVPVADASNDVLKLLKSTDGGKTWGIGNMLLANTKTMQTSPSLDAAATGDLKYVSYDSSGVLNIGRTHLTVNNAIKSTVLDSANTSIESAVSVSPDGKDVTVAWIAVNAVSGLKEVYASTSSDSGATWSAAQVLWSAADTVPMNLDIDSAATSSGSVATVVWAVDGPTADSLYERTVVFGTDETRWLAATELAAGLESLTTRPSVDWAAGSSQAVVVWGATDNGTQAVLAKTGNLDLQSNSTLTMWNTVETLSSGLSGTLASTATAISDDGAAITAAWEINGTPDLVQSASSADRGANWTTKTIAFPEDPAKLRLVGSADGKSLFMVWEARTPASKVIAIARSVDSGVTWGVLPAFATGSEPEIVAARDFTSATVVWKDTGGVMWSQYAVPKTATTLTITTDPVSPKVGEAVKVMAASNPTKAKGTVTVTQGNSTLTCTFDAGECSVTMPAVTTAGTVTYTVSYAGDASYAASSTTKSVTVAAATPAPTTPTTPSTPVVPKPSRASGSDRYATSAEVSKLAFPDGNVPVAYIATGVTFADSLAASAAASASDGPVLLAQGNSLAPAVAQELTRLNPDNIVVLGGASSVSGGLMSSLGAFTDGSVTRTAGADRYATSLAASSVFTQTGGTVILTTGSTFADSLAAGSLFGSFPGPVLLTKEGQGLPAGVAAELKRLAPARVFIVGGTGSVSAQVEADVTAAGYSVTRLAGDDRYETSASVAEWVRSHAGYSAEAIVASGTVFADGLSAGVLAGVRNAPVMLTNGYCWDAESSAVLNRIAPTKLTVIGGAGSISSAAELVTVCK